MTCFGNQVDMPGKTGVLVVGGAGYIGSHMVLALEQAGHTPIILDNLSSGRKNLLPNIKLIAGDMADKSLLSELFSSYSFSAVMHFASFIEVSESVRFPAKYYQNNVLATLHLLDVMLEYKVNRFVFSSSAAVYGNPNYIPIDEAHPLSPINPYGRSKRMVEEIIMDYAKSYGLSYAILRYFNAAGADPMARLGEHHQPESHLLPLVLQVAGKQRESITVYGRDYPTPDGTCIRDYVHVTDLCAAHLLALNALVEGSESMLYNLGTGRGYSVQQVIDTVRRVTGKPVTTVNGTRRMGDPASLVADISRVERELKWKTNYSDLEIIVDHAWRFMQN